MDWLHTSLAPVWSSYVDFCESYALSKLPNHTAMVLLSALVWQVIFYLSSVLSPRVAPRHYGKLSRGKRRSWDAHVVSSLHSIFISYSAYGLLNNRILLGNKVLGYTAWSGDVYAVAVGYFLWDIIIAFVHRDLFSYPFLAHGVSCFLVYLFSFGPLLHWYGAVFLMFEASTPLLNVSWFCDKTGRKGGMVQLVAGLLLLVTFFGVRIFWGISMSVQFYKDFFRTNDLPIPLVMLYSTANVLLNGLNIIWFFMLLQSFSARLKYGKAKADKAIQKSKAAAIKAE